MQKNGIDAKFETMVYNNLLSYGVDINHYLADYEVDFVITTDQASIPVQACQNPSDDKTKEREMSAILKFWEEHSYLNSKVGIVVTNNYKKIEHFGTKKIIFVPFKDIFCMELNQYIQNI